MSHIYSILRLWLDVCKSRPLAWRRPVVKPISEPMVVSLLMHICVIRPQWVNPLVHRPCVIIFKKCNLRTHVDALVPDHLFLNSSKVNVTKPLGDKSTFVCQIICCGQETNHHPIQCWPKSTLSYNITRPQCVNSLRPSDAYVRQ